MLFGDSRDRWDGDGVTDPRVRHFWDEQKVVGNWYSAKGPHRLSRQPNAGTRTPGAAGNSGRGGLPGRGARRRPAVLSGDADQPGHYVRPAGAAVRPTAGPVRGVFTHSRSGDLLSRLNNDVGGIADVVSDTVFGLVSNLITLGTTLILMLVLDWRLTLVVLLP
jgi:hypothetical protein